MAPACLETNHKLVVIVYVPKASSTRRPHQKEEEVQRELQLCDFPADLVAKIVEGLSSADRIRFGSTCKINLSLVTTTKNHRCSYQYLLRDIDTLPWLATFTSHATATVDFSLFEPLHVRGQPNYATYKIKDPNGEGIGGWSETKVKASKKGWLDRLTCRATFSTDPSSPDCVYFFLSQYSIPGKFRISTLDHQTSKQWKTKVFNNLLNNVSSVVYNEGCFYCLSSMGRLAAYDVVHQSLELVITLVFHCLLV